MRGEHGRGWGSKGEQVSRAGRFSGEKPERLRHRGEDTRILPMAGENVRDWATCFVVLDQGNVGKVWRGQGDKVEACL